MFKFGKTDTCILVLVESMQKCELKNILQNKWLVDKDLLTADHFRAPDIIPGVSSDLCSSLCSVYL